MVSESDVRDASVFMAARIEDSDPNETPTRITLNKTTIKKAQPLSLPRLNQKTFMFKASVRSRGVTTKPNAK